MPCGKCIECRLEYARQWAVRCVHEAKMHEDNSFITLTYSDENLKSEKLQYQDFQAFVKRLRSHIHEKFLKKYGKQNWKLLDKKEKKEVYKDVQIGIFVTGEYGEKTKRPHWHALIFNWSPDDLVYHRSNQHGDRLYTSNILTKLWGLGHAEVGSVTFQSAGYCARYAAKKLVHGKDDEHDWHPISKKSSKQAIGKTFCEQYWKDMFTKGYAMVRNRDGIVKVPIPRYYEKWLQKNRPQDWIRYVTTVKAEAMSNADTKRKKEEFAEIVANYKRTIHDGPQITRQEAKRIIINEKFKLLQKNLKGDI